ncbi:arginine--tRNA ligase [Siphonobacter sp. SORGH_AS_1065]|uniref:arginine--tRNA ligase n=1 Tax=Siphonobacter sp. SORGH_AS_1065 TaxID=3041795 RepID=UPI00277F28F4|nr:arginine--tRNA ligase [Siphonobacter sp. SORGH_AS_1065]MDQ1088155.1 arginyl-tRNA synthetase [Siphonobacter sp. SORGH_AS_1065]
MNLNEYIQGALAAALKQEFAIEVAAADLALQPTKKEFEGFYTFVCFPYAKQLKKSPAEIGTKLGEYLVAQNGPVSAFNVVQGFLNLSISDQVWLELFATIHGNESYGQSPDKGQKVMVEYSSPNTNKPLHLGHLRNNFLGYSIAEILKMGGYKVMKTNVVNNRGIHICKSMLAYQLFGNNETPATSDIKGDHLVGKYYVEFDKAYKAQIAELVEGGMEKEKAEKEAPLLKQAEAMLLKWEEGDPATIGLWEMMNSWVYAGFDETYKKMGVNFDKIYYESDTYLLGKDIIEEGLEKGVFYRRPDNSVWIDLTADGLDEKLVLRSNGTSVYITQDLGLADLKAEDFPMQKSVYVVGNEQDYHFKVLFLIMQKLGRPYAAGLYHLSYGMVDLPSGKMKSREGTVVDADDLMQEMNDTAEEMTKELGKIDGFTEEEAKALYHTLAMGALKYFLLKVDPKKRMLFNPQESVDFQGNTGPYIQYNHARIRSILRKADQMELTPTAPTTIDLHASERDLIFTLSQFPQRVEDAGAMYSPALIAQYAYDLAKTYSQFFSEVPIFAEENLDKKQFRVALSKAVAEVIRKAMGLLGVTVPERM